MKLVELARAHAPRREAVERLVGAGLATVEDARALARDERADAARRADACEALAGAFLSGALDRTRAVPALVRALVARERDVRVAAALALQVVGEAHGATALRDLALDRAETSGCALVEWGSSGGRI